jgi:hypothetical protein
MNEIFAAHPDSQELVFPFIGGEEVNESPVHSYHRFVINFGEMTEDEAKQFPQLYEIVKEKVLPLRAGSKRDAYRKRWWQFGEKQKALFDRIKGQERVLVNSQISARHAFTFLQNDMIFSHALNVFALSSYADFGVLQSRTHEVWAQFFSSSLEDRTRYTNTVCFETFPFPLEDISAVEQIGREYFTFRCDLMRETQRGLTKTYNRYHDPHEHSTEIVELRRLHGALDDLVLRAYGWNDLAESSSCDFVLDYEEEVDAADPKRKPWRYTWPADFRDDVLARLLEINEQRHKEELLLVKGKSTEAKPAKKTSKKPAKASATPLLDGLDLVELSSDERLILLIVDSFKRITRTAVDQAFVAMKYPKLRKSRLGLGEPPKSVPRTDPGRDALIGGLVDQGFLEKHPSDYQQIWKLGSNAPSLAPTAAERQALEETQAIFQKSIDTGDTLASCTEGVTDAKPGLVSKA